MAGNAFHWVQPPSVIQEGLLDWQDKVLTAVYAVGELIASEAANEMKMGASWTDRTGVARAALFAVAEQSGGDSVTIYLSHGPAVHYGLYLELDHGQRYAIIYPTIMKMVPRVQALLQGIFN